MLGNLSKRPLGILLHASAVGINLADRCYFSSWIRTYGLTLSSQRPALILTPMPSELLLQESNLHSTINQKLRFELKSLTIGQHITYAIPAQSYVLPLNERGIYKAQYCELVLSQSDTFLQQVCIYLALIILSIATTSVYKIKEKTSKGICIGILHIPLSYINIIT